MSQPPTLVSGANAFELEIQPLQARLNGAFMFASTIDTTMDAKTLYIEIYRKNLRVFRSMYKEPLVVNGWCKRALNRLMTSQAVEGER